MALKVLMLRQRLDIAKKNLAKLEERSAELSTREAEIEESIKEASTEEEQQAVEEAVKSFEEDKNVHETEKSGLEREIAQMEEDLKQEEEKQKEKPDDKKTDERKSEDMERRTRFFGMNMQERSEFFAREDVKQFLMTLRSYKGQQRAVTGGELLIPNVMLELIQENIEEFSKLYKHVNLQKIGGTARQTVAGKIPEAVWTEACAALNELTIGFNMVDIDAFKVGGYIPVCNALLEDNDVNLADVIIRGLGAAIGLALDKAILYGTGVKMPMGIVTRLAQSVSPENYPTKARKWEDLHTSNIVTIASAKTEKQLFKELILGSSAAKGKYSTQGKVWCMNEKTLNALMAECITFNAAGALVSGMNGTMPVLGGVCETLDFIPDNVVIGGYFDLYLLGERGAARIEQSKEVRFIEDQTVFKGTARYDGVPVIAEGFVAIGINGTTPDATMTFAGV